MSVIRAKDRLKKAGDWISNLSNMWQAYPVVAGIIPGILALLDGFGWSVCFMIALSCTVIGLAGVAIYKHLYKGGTQLTYTPSQPESSKAWATKAELEQPHIADRCLYLYEVPRLQHHGLIISGKTFENCDIFGPAVLARIDDTLHINPDCSIEIPSDGSFDSVLWTLKPNTPVVGPIGVQNSSFRKCRFRGVGLCGDGTYIEGTRRKSSELSMRPFSAMQN